TPGPCYGDGIIATLTGSLSEYKPIGKMVLAGRWLIWPSSNNGFAYLDMGTGSNAQPHRLGNNQVNGRAVVATATDAWLLSGGGTGELFRYPLGTPPNGTFDAAASTAYGVALDVVDSDLYVLADQLQHATIPDAGPVSLSVLCRPGGTHVGI